MAEPNSPKVPGALTIIAEQLSRWWADPQTKDLRDGLKWVVPQDAVDAGMMLIGGPGGKAARKAGAALIAAFASTDANAGIYAQLPSNLKRVVAELAQAARAAHPTAAIEFANNGVDGKMVRGGAERLDASKLHFTDYGTALHTHPQAGPMLPSLKDFELWRNRPAQKYLGVVKPKRSGGESAVVIAPRRSPVPTDRELLQHQMRLNRVNPELTKMLSEAGDDASIWKWLLDEGMQDRIDLFLHNVPRPPFKPTTTNLGPATQKAGPPMSQELLDDLATHVDYNGGVSPLLQQHLDAGQVLSAPKTVYRVVPTLELERGLKPGDIYNFNTKNPSTSQSLRGIHEGVLPGLDDFGMSIDDGTASLFKLQLPKGEAWGQPVRSPNRHPLHDLQNEFLLRRSPPIEIRSIDADGMIHGTALPVGSEYLPFVQDFVRSGKWADVGDFSNTGLKRLSDMGNEPMIQRAREKFGEYVTPTEWDQIMSGKAGFAEGGPVKADCGCEPKGYAAGGAVKEETKQQKLAREMTHTRSSSQDQSTQPLDGSILKALVRGWIAGTAGIPGDLEGLARMGINKAFGAGGVSVDEAPALPTTDFYKEWLPGKQVGDENVATVGSLFGGAGMGTIAKGTNKAARAVPGALTQMARNAAVPRTLSPQAGVIKAPGGNWLSGSVEDALKRLKATREPLDMAQTQWEELTPQSQALNSFIDNQLTRYVKNDMATERDPLRALAERGVLHVDPEQLNFQVPMHGKYLEEGQTAVAQAPGAKAWEGAADARVLGAKARAILNPNEEFIEASFGAPGLLARNPDITKMKPDAMVHAINEPRRFANNLGFDHLIDELRNATNPASGLPRELLLKPESLDRVSVPQAVERVAKINAWREAQKVAANEALANNAATHVFKEYAENNPKGLRWVELKKQEKIPEGWTTGKDRFDREQWITPEGRLTEDNMDPRLAALRDALKYEGDTMGHCVGRYCNDVASGRSRIFSLRDAKGQPHVTIETRPPRDAYPVSGEAFAMLPQETKDHYRAITAEWRKTNPTDPDVWKALAEAGIEPAAPSILQIKGKGDRKPNDEYLPFVQDFVKSGKWGDVGDLENAGLLQYTRGRQTVPDGLTGRTTMGVAFDEVGIPEGYYTNDELLKHMRDWQLRTGNKLGYAEGGPVREAIDGQVVLPERIVPPESTAIENASLPDSPPPAVLRGSGDDMWEDTSAQKAWYAAKQAEYTKAHSMSREDFLKKYGPVFVADDKGGNAASEVAGQDVGAYYDKYLAPGAKTTQTVSRGWDSDPAEQPIVWGHKYRDAHPYFDAYDNVNPHPKSQDLGGFGEFWRQVGRPVAAGVGMYLGAGALGNLAGAAPAATGSASGLAGQLGMGKGALATAFNTGALNTGVGVLRGQDLGTALKGGVTSALLSPVGGVVNNAVGGGALGTIAGRTATGALQGLATGRGLSDGLQQGVVSGVTDLAGDYVGGQVGQATGSKLAGTLASSATKSALRGKGLSIDALASQYAAGKITDLAGLPPDIVKLLVNLARSKKGSTVGPLSRAKRA